MSAWSNTPFALGSATSRTLIRRRSSYVVSGGTIRVTTSDGRSLVYEEKAGDTTWSEPVPRHTVENIGPTPVRIVLVEVK